MSLIDPGQFLGLITRMLSHVSSFFLSALVVFLTVIFMLIMGCALHWFLRSFSVTHPIILAVMAEKFLMAEKFR
ncbi:MAG: hypothetical protein ACR5LF_08195 [Symbiopectobacterium sp.]